LVLSRAASVAILPSALFVERLLEVDHYGSDDNHVDFHVGGLIDDVRAPARDEVGRENCGSAGELWSRLRVD
jgi:hypothetical protein